MTESKRTYYIYRRFRRRMEKTPSSDLSKMILAIRVGDLNTVRFLLCANPLREGRYHGGYGILLEAIRYKRNEIVDLLIKEGAKINSTRKKKETALEVAKENGNSEIVKMLTTNGASTNDRNTTRYNVVRYRNLIRHINMPGYCRSDIYLRSQATHRFEFTCVDHLLGRSSLYCASYHLASDGLEFPPMFHNAILRDSTDMDTSVLSRGVNLNTLNKDGETALYIAIKERNSTIIKILLAQGACVHTVSPSWKGYTPLHLACENGLIEIVELLLRKGADVNYVTKNKVTSIYLAVKSHNYELTKLLLNYKANVNARDKYGKTILHLAVEFGDSQIVDEILSHAPNIINNISNKKSLRTAVCHRKSSNYIVNSLLQYGLTFGPEDVNDHKLLRAAIENGYVVIVEKLLQCGVKLNNEPKLLAIAVRKRLKKMIKLLLKHGCKVNTVDKHGYSALHWIALPKQPTLHEDDNNDVNISIIVHIIKLLLKKKAVIDAKTKTGLTTLHLAIQNEHKDIARILLERGANVNLKTESGATPLHFVAQKRMTEICILLVKREADLNTQDTQGLTALHLAIQERNEEVAQILLDHGADVSLKTESGATPLHFVAQKGMTEICRLLVKREADLNTQDTQGLTALHLAIQERNEEVAQILLDHGADVSLKTESGATYLHFVAQNGMEKVCRFLVRRGLDVNAKDKRELTALHLAAQSGHEDIVEILLDCSIDVNSMDENGNTAIHLASETMQHRAFIALVDSSDINIVNKRKRTALHFLIHSYFKFLDHYRDHNRDHNLDYNRYHNRDDNRNHELRRRKKYERKFKSIQRHLLKMQVAGLNVNKEDLKAVISLTMIIDLPKLEREYKKEVEKMKNTKINNAEITFHDILIKDIDQVVSVMRDPYLVQSLTVKSYQKKFPLYADMIKRRLDKAIVRKEFLDESCTFFHGRFITPYLPLNCIEHLLSYLSNTDIMILKDIFKNSDSNIDNVLE